MKTENFLCGICNIQFKDSPSAKRKYCSYSCYFKSKIGTIPWNKSRIGWTKDFEGVGFQVNNHLWKRRVLKTRKRHIHKGYILIYTPNHPNHNNQGYVKEHRLVMEQHIGRFLKKQEVVHHIDHNKINNDISNLMLFDNNREHMIYDRATRVVR